MCDIRTRFRLSTSTCRFTSRMQQLCEDLSLFTRELFKSEIVRTVAVLPTHATSFEGRPSVNVCGVERLFCNTHMK